MMPAGLPLHALWPYGRDAWSVVFGSDEDHCVAAAQLTLQTLHFRRLRLVVVLVVERQVADLQFLETEIRRPEFDERRRQSAVERFLAEAADDITDLFDHS
jgi:hypothetical protein